MGNHQWVVHKRYHNSAPQVDCPLCVKKEKKKVYNLQILNIHIILKAAFCHQTLQHSSLKSVVIEEPYFRQPKIYGGGNCTGISPPPPLIFFSITFEVFIVTPSNFVTFPNFYLSLLWEEEKIGKYAAVLPWQPPFVSE